MHDEKQVKKKTQSISTMMQLQRGSTSAKWTAILFYFKIENSDYNYKIYFILWKCYFVSSHGRMTEMKSFSCNALKRKRVPKKTHAEDWRNIVLCERMDWNKNKRQTTRKKSTKCRTKNMKKKSAIAQKSGKKCTQRFCSDSWNVWTESRKQKYPIRTQICYNNIAL